MMWTDLRAFVKDSLASTAEARSGLSSTMLRLRIWPKLCRIVSSSLTTAGYSRESTTGSFGAFEVAGFLEARGAEAV